MLWSKRGKQLSPILKAHSFWGMNVPELVGALSGAQFKGSIAFLPLLKYLLH